MGGLQSSVFQDVAMQIKQQKDLLLGQIGQLVDSLLGDLRKEILTKPSEQDSKISQRETRLAQQRACFRFQEAHSSPPLEDYDPDGIHERDLHLRECGGGCPCEGYEW
eukprot:9133315-Karenia_brevis.AAC.1